MSWVCVFGDWSLFFIISYAYRVHISWWSTDFNMIPEASRTWCRAACNHVLIRKEHTYNVTGVDYPPTSEIRDGSRGEQIMFSHFRIEVSIWTHPGVNPNTNLPSGTVLFSSSCLGQVGLVRKCAGKRFVGNVLCEKFVATAFFFLAPMCSLVRTWVSRIFLLRSLMYNTNLK